MKVSWDWIVLQLKFVVHVCHKIVCLAVGVVVSAAAAAAGVAIRVFLFSGCC